MKLKKIMYFVILCLWALGFVGGVGYAVYGGSYPIAIGVLTNAILAFSEVKEIWNKLIV